MNQCTTKPLFGVALLVWNRYGECLLVKEKWTKANLGKYAGMWSFPMETLCPDEQMCHRIGLLRLIAEEIGYLQGSIDQFEYRGTYAIAPCAEASLYSARTCRIDVPTLPFESDEIGEYRWLHPSEAPALWLRQGMPEMLEDILAGVTQVIRTTYRPAVLPGQ